jgi:hypothetical protein
LQHNYFGNVPVLKGFLCIILKVYHNITWGKCIFCLKRAKFVKNREKLEIVHKMLVLEQNITNQTFNNTFSGVQLK